MPTVIEFNGLYISHILCVDENNLTITLRPCNTTVEGTNNFHELPRVEYLGGSPPQSYEFEVVDNGTNQMFVVRPYPEIRGHDQTVSAFDVHVPQIIPSNGSSYVFNVVRRSDQWVRNVRPRLMVSGPQVGMGRSTSGDGPDESDQGNQVVNIDPNVNEVIIPVEEAPPQMVNIGLTEGEIMSVLNPTVYSANLSEEAEAEAELCCICQEEYITDEYINTLNCNHVFHFGCIKTWLKHNKLCPICRKNVMEE